MISCSVWARTRTARGCGTRGERLTSQAADALVEHLDPRGVAVVVEAEHSCLRLRGARKEAAEMVTTAFRGALEHDRGLRPEVLSLMGVGR